MAEDRTLVRVLDVDPELGYRLDDEDRAAARRFAVAEVVALDPGPWPEASEAPDDGPQVGLLVLDGLVVHELRLGSGVCAELLGAGDLLRPWDEYSAQSIPGWSASWRVLEPARLAVLDRRFATVASRWPALLDVIMRRSVMRARAAGFLRAVTHMTRVDDRLLVLMWFLAERWGRVRPEGVVVPLKLTHQLLAALVGAKRPSVTTALGELTSAGLVERRDDGSWLLHGEPPAAPGRRRDSEPVAA
ncbi:MAG: family transcriptional regulator, cyclic receptor protein [Solirubrobacteraceae bacterium]|jgi:DNA-binding transcriptional ArsR family regulator|nr:family transcriptional regulator, cyclic receptor protein [Solirubrobacteraceae bacterium]